ncbi:glutamyl-tRNA reductase [Saprospira sp. CCB-QB6]|uniref:glutamyl-tRNA reductase n=1 Tax=Saprospira sp. CCB-QB6 TaxID=3023936 RepID=UPI002348F7AA|nr:glutamyl-tRNA reductase [Saprospira sp. CCB-QB6]WCL80110.1 glutamyl-tRNA reductase [Saprospira sp. CCB-QB6]
MKAIEQYKIITFTHRRTDLNGIGQFVLRPKTEEESVLEQLHAFKQQIGAKEIYYLSTCNRILFLVLAQKEDKGKAFKQKFMQRLYADLSEELQAKAIKEAFLYEGLEAIDHFFRVSASMDSLVVGEREILRQLREAYQDNLEQGLTGDAIRLLMRFTVETAKRVYSSTRIGEKPVSVVSLAVSKLMQAQLPPSSRFLLLGAGQTNALFAKFLKKYGYNKVTVFNRSLKKAEELAQEFDGEGLLLSQLSEYRKGFDVVVAATGAKSALLTTELYQQLLGEEAATSSKLLIDLSIPNNIEPAIAEKYPKAQYVPIESLRELAQKNLAFREQELERAKEVVEEQVDIFYQAFKERLIELALKEVPIQVKAIRQHALNNVFKKELADLDEESLALLDRMMAYMEKRCIAIPLQVAKQNMLKED